MLVTRASDGMTLVEQATETHFPARTRDVYDTSGAGDTVISVLGASISSGFTLKDSVGLSNIAAGIVVGNFESNPKRRPIWGWPNLFLDHSKKLF